MVTNSDGRCDGPLLQEAELAAGQYELLFHVGDYLRAGGVQLSEPPFLDLVPLRFGIADPGQHYHVPLLISPYATRPTAAAEVKVTYAGQAKR